MDSKKNLSQRKCMPCEGGVKPLDKEQSKKFLLGQVMRATKGQADPSVSMSLINEILDKKK